jgi:hypothetical protein
MNNHTKTLIALLEQEDQLSLAYRLAKFNQNTELASEIKGKLLVIRDRYYRLSSEGYNEQIAAMLNSELALDDA